MAAIKFDLPFKHGKKAKLVLEDMMLRICSRRACSNFSAPQFNIQVLEQI